MPSYSPQHEAEQEGQRDCNPARQGYFWGVLTSAVWEPPGGLLQHLGHLEVGSGGLPTEKLAPPHPCQTRSPECETCTTAILEKIRLLSLQPSGVSVASGGVGALAFEVLRQVFPLHLSAPWTLSPLPSKLIGHLSALDFWPAFFF